MGRSLTVLGTAGARFAALLSLPFTAVAVWQFVHHSTESGWFWLFWATLVWSLVLVLAYHRVRVERDDFKEVAEAKGGIVMRRNVALNNPGVGFQVEQHHHHQPAVEPENSSTVKDEEEGEDAKQP